MLVTTPQSRLTPCQLPGRGAFLGGLPLTKSCPRVRGKWHGEAMTKGERLKAAQLFYCSPQSAYAASSPINGGAFGVQYKHGVQCRTPSRSDRFNGVTGGAGGPKGRNRNLPWPPCKKGYIVSLFSFVYVNPSVHSLTLMSTSPFRAGLIRVLPTKKTTLRLSFFSLYSSLPLGAITTRRLGSSPSLYVVT